METCPARAKSIKPLGHRNVQLPGRVGVDDRVAMALGGKFVLRQPAKVAQHLEAVLHLSLPARKDERHLVAQRQLRPHGLVMPHLGAHILRFHQRRDHVEDVEGLCKLHEFTKVPRRPGPAPALQVRRMGAPRAGLKHQRAKLQHHVPLSHPGSKRDRLRCRGQRRFDHVAPDIHHVTRDPRPALCIEPDRPVRQDPDPQPFQHVERRLVHRRDTVVGKDVHRRERVFQPAVVDIAPGRGLGPAPAPPRPHLGHPRMALECGS